MSEPDFIALSAPHTQGLGDVPASMMFARPKWRCIQLRMGPTRRSANIRWQLKQNKLLLSINASDCLWEEIRWQLNPHRFSIARVTGHDARSADYEVHMMLRQ
jgi:hypothetical protein